MSEYWLLPMAFVSSCVAGIMGMGGGILLIAVMPGFVPAAAILPLHAAAQFASNASRAAFGFTRIAWSILPAFSVGALAGAWSGAEIYQMLDLRWLPALIGGFILLITWLPLPTISRGGQFALALLGFYQTGLGMLAGATGPLGAAVLLQRNRERDWLVVNTAFYMSVNHMLRLAAYTAMGFSFAPWWPLLAGMVAAVVLGSWVGTRLRKRIGQINFLRLFRWLITLLAVRLVALSLLGQG